MATPCARSGILVGQLNPMVTDDRIGTLVAGKYKLEAAIGRGGMGMVYRATHTWTGRPCAVKCLHPEHARDSMSVARFLREARAAATVRHPNAVDVLDMGQDADGSAYLVLELLEGETLAQRLLAVRPLPLSETVSVLVPVMDALDELHKAGVVHRDFKPANIFLSRNNKGMVVPKLLDFGVAKVIDSQSSTATTTGIVVGTPAYMAPEQAAGNGDIGPYTDVWAAGAVLYECLTGKLPFAAPTPSLMLVNVMTKPFVPVEQLRPDLPLELRRVIEQALAKSPEDRFQSMSEMATVLCQAAERAGPELLGGSSSQMALLQARFAKTVAASVDALTPPSPNATTDSYGRGKSWTDANGTGVMGHTRQRKRLSFGLLGAAVGGLAIVLGTQFLGAPKSEQTPSAAELPAARTENVGSSSARVKPVGEPVPSVAKPAEELPSAPPVAPVPGPNGTPDVAVAVAPNVPSASSSGSAAPADKTSVGGKKRRKKPPSSATSAPPTAPSPPEKAVGVAPVEAAPRPVPSVDRTW